MFYLSWRGRRPTVTVRGWKDGEEKKSGEMRLEEENIYNNGTREEKEVWEGSQGRWKQENLKIKTRKEEKWSRNQGNKGVKKTRK